MQNKEVDHVTLSKHEAEKPLQHRMSEQRIVEPLKARALWTDQADVLREIGQFAQFGRGHRYYD